MKNIILENKSESLNILAVYIVEMAEEFRLSPSQAFEINLVLDELVTNMISYGFPDKQIHFIEIASELNDRVLEIKLIDDGIEFNPLEKEDTDINLPLEDKAIGGLGIFLVKQKMDKISYERKAGRNILYLSKKIF